MDKYQEALNRLNTNMNTTSDTLEYGIILEEDSKRQMKILQELVDKETPKSVEKDWVIDDGVEREIPICPACKNIYLTRMQNYCDCCGQKLDWSEEE